MSFQSLLLVALCLVISLPNAATAQNKVAPQTNKEVTYRGNVFKIHSFPQDTVEVVDPITGETGIVITSKSDWFVSMNGERIKLVNKKKEGVSTTEYDDWYYRVTTEYLGTRIQESLNELKKDLQPGIYNYGIENVVIDKDGIVVFNNPSGIYKVKVMGLDGEPLPEEPISDELQNAIKEDMKLTLENTKLEQYEVDGQRHIVSLHISGSLEVL